MASLTSLKGQRSIRPDEHGHRTSAPRRPSTSCSVDSYVPCNHQSITTCREDMRGEIQCYYYQLMFHIMTWDWWDASQNFNTYSHFYLLLSQLKLGNIEIFLLILFMNHSTESAPLGNSWGSVNLVVYPHLIWQSIKLNTENVLIHSLLST